MLRKKAIIIVGAFLSATSIISAKQHDFQQRNTDIALHTVNNETEREKDIVILANETAKELLNGSMQFDEMRDIDSSLPEAATFLTHLAREYLFEFWGKCKKFGIPFYMASCGYGLWTPENLQKLPDNLRKYFAEVGVSVQDLLDRGLIMQGHFEERVFFKSVGGNTLSLGGSRINSLKGLANVPGIKEIQCLDLRNNMLTEIEAHAFAGLEHLEAIDLSENLITEIAPNAFAELKNVRYLAITNTFSIYELLQNVPLYEVNRLLERRVSGCPDDASLNIRTRVPKLTNLNSETFAGLCSLKILILDYCQLTIEDINSDLFLSIPQLEELYLRHNLLNARSSQPFRHLEHLRKLSLSCNCIKEIDMNFFEGLNNLKELNLSHNAIRTFNSNIFKNVRELKTLNLSHNEFFRLKRTGFNLLGKLKKLDLSASRIRAIESQSFIGLSALQKLELDSNEFIWIEKGAFAGLKSLKKISIGIRNLDEHLGEDLNEDLDEKQLFRHVLKRIYQELPYVKITLW